MKMLHARWCFYDANFRSKRKHCNHFPVSSMYTLRRNRSPHCTSPSQSAFCRHSIEWADYMKGKPSWTCQSCQLFNQHWTNWAVTSTAQWADCFLECGYINEGVVEMIWEKKSTSWMEIFIHFFHILDPHVWCTQGYSIKVVGNWLLYSMLHCFNEKKSQL